MRVLTRAQVVRGGCNGLCVAALALAACDPGEVVLADVAGFQSEAGDTVNVRVFGADGAPAVNATVHYLRRDVTEHLLQTVAADASGLAGLDRLQGGSLYWVAAEVEDAAQGWLGGGEKVYGPTQGSVDLPIHLSPPRTDGILIGEVYMQSPPAWEIGNQYYEYSKYIELANNSDTIVHLDGALVGYAYSYWRDDGQYGHHRCEDTESMRNDSAGVWSHVMWRLPGAGNDYPLQPSEAVVIAIAAADHRGIHPSMLDLSDAAFEFGTPGVADNPAAGNLELLGPNAPSTVTNDFALAHEFWFVAAPADVTTFPKAFDPGSPDRKNEYWRVPRESILDVAFIWWDRTGNYTTLGPPKPCKDPVHPDFERLPGGFLHSNDLYVSAQRRRVIVDGRSVLLDTQTSMVDFIKADRTPGWLP